MGTEVRADAFVRETYMRLFEWLTWRVNQALGDSPGDGHTIHLVELAGFAALRTNPLEQLCINYANEVLQSLFVTRAITAEEKLQIDEGFDMPMLIMPSNAVDLIGSKAESLLWLLERSSSGGITEASFFRELRQRHANSPHLAHGRVREGARAGASERRRGEGRDRQAA